MEYDDPSKKDFLNDPARNRDHWANWTRCRVCGHIARQVKIHHWLSSDEFLCVDCVDTIKKL